MKLPRYYEDISQLHVNTLPNRAYFVPYQDRESALQDDRTASDRVTMLSGTWHFGYYESMLDLPEDLFAASAAPDTIPVPSVWQCHGYDNHQYTNAAFPIPFDPPYVPVENPCGLYTRTFSWTAEEGGATTLHFEGVDSGFYVWVNGAFVGYSQVAHSTSAFDVTNKLQEGGNTVTVLVLKWCDGTYFEDQDKLRMSGIFRDVYLMHRSAAHLTDYFVHTDLNADFTAADIRVELERSQSAPVSYELMDAEGQVIARGETGGDILIPVENVHLWNSEDPYLYTLVMNCGGEWIMEKVGVRRMYVENGVVKVNGQALKFKGVNRHDSDPYVGAAVSMEDMLRDLRVMKEHNVNAIRTSHYPNAPEFYKLCDKFGFYVIDEADMECHGVNGAVGLASWVDDYNYLANDPKYEEVFMDRAQRCVIRDKNRPCVVLWSTGNESGDGCNFYKVLAWMKQYDPSRLTHHEKAAQPPTGQEINKANLDTYSRMYTSIEENDRYFAEGKIGLPYVLCEYCHAMGNGPGDLEDYFWCFHRHEGHFGGFIWEWCDHSIYMGRTADNRRKFFYGGDFGEDLHSGNFCMDGLVYPDRTPHTGLKEYKNVLRPARLVASDVEKGLFTFWNTLDFTSLKDAIRMTYTVRQNGQDVYTAEVPAELLDIAPHGRKEIALKLPEGLKGAYAVHFTEYQLKDEPLTPAGHIVGEDEAGRQDYKAPAMPDSRSVVTVKETARHLILEGRDFRYAYNKGTAAFDEMVYRNHTLLDRPMHWNIWHAPTDNDRRLTMTWKRKRYDLMTGRGYETSVKRVSGGWELETAFSIASQSKSPVVSGKVKWIVKQNGKLVMKVDAKSRPQDPELPNFGLRMFLPGAMKNVEYFGYGPYESYIDKHQASFRHLYASTVEEMHEDYLKPQENGSHYDCSYIQVADEECALQVTGKSFSFSASPYTQEELGSKAHNYELEKCGSTVLCVEGYHSGVGSASCGPELAEKYRVPRKLRYSVEFSAILK